MGENSGVSRNRPVRSELNARKLPQLFRPRPTVNSSPTVPKDPYRARKLAKGFCPNPDRVVALMTRLVLSPYSAGGEPEITSIDSIAFAGIEAEKTLLR